MTSWPSASRLLYFLLVCVLLLSGVPAGLAQAPDQEHPSERPKIGIALGGGGARGAAHVGVLQVLQEMNIPIDYVSGTSMGSIVGSLFAIGMTPDEIEQQITAVDWDDLFSDRPNRVDRNFRRKQDDTSFFLPVEFGLKDKKIVFSSGIIAGQKLGFAFRDPRLYLGGYQGFDKLAYPFRPVATDLATGDMFVMEKGNLLKAVRASMSIPGVFPPVEWEGHHLVDGYLARNLPVDVVRDMGADIVIAVDVGSLPEDTDPEKFHTILGINEQQGIIQARQNVDLQLPRADYVIHVELGDIQTRDFKLVPETIPLGREAALKVADQLEALSVPAEEYREHLQQHRMINVDMMIIDTIELVNNSRIDDRAIRRNIHQKIGRPLDLERLKQDLVRVFDFGIFELVDFEIFKNYAGQTTLRIIANDKYYSPNILNIGLTYSGGSGGRSYLDARMRATRLEMNRYGSEWRTDLQMGRNTGIKTEYYQPLTWTRVPFVAVGGSWQNQYRDWYIEEFHLGDLQIEEIMARGDLGLRLGHYGEVRGGVAFGHLWSEDRTQLDLYDFNGPIGGYTAQLNIDMLNASSIPTAGYLLQSRVYFADDAFGSGLNYTKAQAQGLLVHSWGKNTVGLGMSGGSSLGTELPEFAMFTVGGPGKLEGYHPDQFQGQAYGLASLGLFRKIKGHPSPYSTSWYLGARLEAGNAWRNLDNAGWDNLRYCASVSLVVKTIMGPFAMTYGRAKDGADAFTMSLGNLTPFLE